ncbi:MAG: toxic anion resistance protein [Veillonella sp.]|uniref:toxic anion resistance protein n=1 Tax=Veillonella sp. TaxID=1926307 RepID=UPI0025F86C39|nr:toxic anion resistance protein [Veillonella sp.]MBS4912602.1 toxic anion resistance protein [Veillonella sp.]
MAEINLNDLLEMNQKTGSQNTSDTYEAEEINRISQQIESLTPEEKIKVESLKNSINLLAPNAISQYGVSAQENISSFATSILSTEKSTTKDIAGNLLNNVLQQVYEFKKEQSGQSSLASLPLVGSFFKKSTPIKELYMTRAMQIDKIVAELDKQKSILMKDIVMFDGLFNKNLDYYKELQLYILAGEKKIQELYEKTLPSLDKDARESDNPMAQQAVIDFKSTVDRFEKKIDDLKVTKSIALHTAPQIRTIQNDNKNLVEEIQRAIYNSIPLWKTHMVVLLGLSRQQQALKLHQTITDTTNDLLKRNSELLKQNARATAIANERAIIDMDTIRKVNDDLIATIEDTIRIHQEGRQRRKAAERELLQIEGKLKEALLKSSGRKV